MTDLTPSPVSQFDGIAGGLHDLSVGFLDRSF
jgi:hypothetical protein